MSWLSWHEKSEKLASEAHQCLREGKLETATKLFEKAAKAETNALNDLDFTKTRTLGVTAVSAVSLWFKAQELSKAEETAFRWLSSSSIPEFAREQLKNLVQTVWIKQAMQTAGVSFLPGQVTVSVKGGMTISGGAPLDLIVDKVQTVQAIFYRTIEFLKKLPHRMRGAPAQEIQEACRPWLFQALPGSYQFSVAVQEPTQADFFKESEPDAKQVADHFISILKASSENPEVELPKLIPAADYRNTFLKLTRNLAPTGKNFSQVDIKGAGDTQSISLLPEMRKEISRVLRPSRIDSTPAEEPVDVRGILRALHLERDWIDVLVEGEIVHITGLSETVDDTIGPMVNRLVVVHVTKLKNGQLRFLDIEADD